MYLTEAEFDLLAREAVETAIAELIDLKTLGRCPPEVFEQRVINLGGGRLVTIQNADKSALWLLAGQLRAAGLPIPRLLRDRLAAAPGPQAA